MAEASAKVVNHRGQGLSRNGRPGDEDEDEALAEPVLFQAEGLAQETPGAASLDRAADPPAGHHTECGRLAVRVLQPIGDETAAGPPLPTGSDAREGA